MKSVQDKNKKNFFVTLFSRFAEWIRGFRARPRGAVVVLSVIALLVLIWLTPWARLLDLLLETPAQKFERLRDILRIIIQVGIGLIVLIGFSFFRRRSRARDLAAGFEREMRLSERFTRAVEQLGGAQAQVRLGGIYALDRIVREAPEEAAPVAGILSAFIRERTSGAEEQPGEPGADIQTALTLLTSRGPYEGDALDLRGTVLMGADLNTAALRNARLDNARLAGADLREANLRHALLNDARIMKADLRGADLRDARLDGALLNGALLTNANLEDCRLNDCDLTGAQLSGASLKGANLSRAVLTDASLGEAELGGANLSGAALIRADLANARLDECNLTGTNASECGLSGARLRGAFLFEADLRGAHAGGADFTNGNLTGANLKQANLTGADLQNTNLAGANLQQAHLFEANLLHADLTAANLRNVIGLSLKQLFETRTLYRAVLDDELRLQVERDYPELLREPPAAAGGAGAPPQGRLRV